MTSLNRQRANIVFSTVFETDLLEEHKPKDVAARFLRPDEAAHRERVFERDGILRWFGSSSSSSSNEKLGWCRIGSSMQELISSSSSSSSSTLSTTSLPKLVHIFASEQYILVPHKPSQTQKKTTKITILLKQNCTPTQQLKAWAHALLVARLASLPKSEDTGANADDENNDNDDIMAILTTSLSSFSARFDDFYVSELERAGWDLGIAALETRAGRRINIADS